MYQFASWPLDHGKVRLVRLIEKYALLQEARMLDRGGRKPALRADLRPVRWTWSRSRMEATTYRAR